MREEEYDQEQELRSQEPASGPAAPDPLFSESVRELIVFLRQPQLLEPEQPHAPLRTFFHLLVLSFSLSLLSILLMNAVQKSGLLPELPHAMEGIMKDMPFALVFFLVALLMPALEELAFRLWLVYQPRYVIISLWLIAFFVSQAFLQNGLDPIGYGVLGLAAMATILLLTFRDRADAGLHSLYRRYYSWLFYGATLLFALVHLINFSLTPRLLLFAPLLVLPQFLLGLVLGYIRVRQGLIWAIALHALYNSIILLLAYWGMQAQETITP
jgi:membrane protease YdiL (CAAX protease family)